MGELNNKRLNFMTSSVVDLKFRTQAKEHGMGLSEYFKHLVLMVDKQKVDKQNFTNLLKASDKALANVFNQSKE